jgi:hypothetical protein
MKGSENRLGMVEVIQAALKNLVIEHDGHQQVNALL